MSCTRGTLKQIISSYKSHLRSATVGEDNAKIVDPFLCLNIACPPGAYDANVEPAKDDVLFTDSELLLEIVERWFHSIYGEVQPNFSRPSAKTVSALNPRGIELLLARTIAPVESAPVGISRVGGSTLPAPRSASKLTTHPQPHSNPLATSAFDPSAAAPPRQKSDGISGAISHSITEPPATDETQTRAPRGPPPSHDFSTPMLSEKAGLRPSSNVVPVEGNPGWIGSMYAEDEDDAEDLELDLRGRPRSSADIDPDGEEHLRDVDVSNPWAFAKLNAAMRPSGRNKQLHTPRRQIGDVGHSPAPSSDDLPRDLDASLAEKPLRRVHQAHSSSEAAYPTPSPFPFPQKARGKRQAGDASVDAFSTPAPSKGERHRRGALDTWVQKSLGGYDELGDTSNTVQRSLGGYDELDYSPNTLQEDPGAPDQPCSRDFVSARSLPPGGTPLSEIPDASQRARRKPWPRKQQQGNIDKPFIFPVNDPNRVWFDTRENPSQKRPQRLRPNNDHQDIPTVPTLILRDDEIEEDEPVISASAERSLPPIHPDLAITLDYEARKQKAGEAHRKALREQAAAAKLASKAPADGPNPLHPQHATTSPHKNRQAKAIAALHTSDGPSPATPSLRAEGTAALEPSDPRAYLLRMQQQGEQARESLRGRSKRQKTAMLPLETVQEGSYIGDLSLMVEDVHVGDVEEDMKDSGAWDHYVKSGEVGEAFEKVSMEEIKRWEGKLRDSLRGMYAVEGEEGERADVDVDLSKILRAHLAGYA